MTTYIGEDGTPESGPAVELPPLAFPTRLVAADDGAGTLVLVVWDAHGANAFVADASGTRPASPPIPADLEIDTDATRGRTIATAFAGAFRIAGESAGRAVLVSVAPSGASEVHALAGKLTHLMPGAARLYGLVDDTGWVVELDATLGSYLDTPVDTEGPIVVDGERFIQLVRPVTDGRSGVFLETSGLDGRRIEDHVVELDGPVHEGCSHD